MIRQPHILGPSHTSQSQRYNSASKKQYSYSQMKHWCQQMVRVESGQLLQEINQNNQVIKVLSEKIKKLEEQLREKEEGIGIGMGMGGRGYGIGNGKGMGKRKQIQGEGMDVDKIINIMNNLINSKLQDVQEEVERKLVSLESTTHQLIKIYSQKKVENHQNKMEQEITSQIAGLKQFVKQRLDHTNHYNSEHWGKIKRWVAKLQGRFEECSAKGDQIQKSMQKVQEDIGSGLLGIYKVRNFNTRVKEVEMAVYDLQESFKNITEYQGEYRLLVQKSAKEDSIDSLRLRYNPRYNNEYQLNQKPQQSRSKGKSKNSLDKLSPLQIDLAQKQSNPVFPINSFSSNRTARKHQNNVLRSDSSTRLIKLIQQKSLQIPISCYRDEFGYLKNSMNNYIFDLQGNMFKLSFEEFQKLSGPQQNILKAI